MIEAGLYQLLTANVGVTTLVSKNVFPLWRKSLPVPSVVFQGVTGTAVNTMDGESPLRTRRFQFDCYSRAEDYFASRKLADAVRAALVPAAGAGGYPFNLPDGTEIQSATVHLDMDMPPEEGSGGYICRAVLDIEFVHIPAS